MPIYQYNQLKVPLTKKDDVLKRLSRQLRIPPAKILNFQILRMSLDGRKGREKQWVFNVSFELEQKFKHAQLIEITPSLQTTPQIGKKFFKEVHIVGSGPCGMSAALAMVEKGYQVHVYEQGNPVEERFRDIRFFLKKGELNPRSNVLFGEGGAGAFSDGKLTSRTRNEFTKKVLQDWVAAGADPSIEYFSKPHIGTDKLQFIVRNLRKRIIELGGQFHFNAKLDQIRIENNALLSFAINGKWIESEHLVLATGHSARDIYELLDELGVAMEHKPFAVGFRAEHPQSLINLRQLGENAPIEWTGAAEYSLNAPLCESLPGAYSFCMCPGGVLIPCAGDPGELATNGMSYSGRSGKFANAGIVVPVNLGENVAPLDGVRFQRAIEQKAFQIGGGDYSAPAQLIQSFLDDKEDIVLPKSSYPRGLIPHNHNDFYSSEITQSLKNSFQFFEKKIPGFIEKGLLVSPETRTSSPVRILRDEDTLESVNVKGLYPLGEGAGFAGGIISSAADGVRFAAQFKVVHA